MSIHKPRNSFIEFSIAHRRELMFGEVSESHTYPVDSRLSILHPSELVSSTSNVLRLPSPQIMELAHS
jgi:hypothetical protein